jgi:hypothetical protein
MSRALSATKKPAAPVLECRPDYLYAIPGHNDGCASKTVPSITPFPLSDFFFLATGSELAVMIGPQDKCAKVSAIAASLLKEICHSS